MSVLRHLTDRTSHIAGQSAPGPSVSRESQLADLRGLQSVIGNHGVRRVLAHAQHPSSFAPAARTSDAVQRLMQLEGTGGFKDRSGGFFAGPRNKVTVIDDELADFHANLAHYSVRETLGGLQRIIDRCNTYLALPPNTTNETRRTGVRALRAEAIQERDHLSGAQTDWANAAVTFRTRNTENAFGDSVYTVTATGYSRYAPVNRIRAPQQVNFGPVARHFCYLTPGTDAYDAVMHSDDSDVQVRAVEGQTVVFQIGGEQYRVPIQPSAGDCPFDFDYNPTDGTITHGHVGHALYGIA